ncbi:MAG: hypothetical protein LBJ48_00505 [Coriobacteriales bacterium]|jgi:hypothetical protein|nr:hypothetical protein [Coriobacteriales bacterium]
MKIPTSMTMDLPLAELIINPTKDKQEELKDWFEMSVTPQEKKEADIERAKRDGPLLKQLGQEIGVPFNYLVFGYTTQVEYSDGPKSKAYATVEEFRQDLLNDYSCAMVTKAVWLLTMSKNDTLSAYGENYTEKDVESFHPLFQKWIESNGGTVPKQGGCYVATAVYGSYDCPQVWTLRRYRDLALSRTLCGRAFIKAYYAISPTLVTWFSRSSWFNATVKPLLNRIVDKLKRQGYRDTPYDD